MAICFGLSTSIMDVCSPCRIPLSSATLILSNPINPNFTPLRLNSKGGSLSNITMAATRNASLPRMASADELRRSLLFALASQTITQSQRLVQDLVSEALKYVNPRRFEGRTLEETLMAVPDLETVPFRVLRKEKDYEIREVKSYYVAEITMPGKTGFDFYGSSQAFNALAAYLFGKNTRSEAMEMTTPVLVQKTQIDGEKMEMTTPVFTKQEQDPGKWQMSFFMPSKYGENLPLPNDPSIRIRQILEKTVAVTAFSGYVTDEEVKRRESKLREALSKDPLVRVKDNATVEIAQYNPPFTPPFMRRNEVSLEVEVERNKD